LLDHRHKATDPDTEVLTLTSASRDLPPPAAAKNIRIAMDAALARKPRIVICKIDSTLRGNVANAILVALQGSGMRHALIATAVPSQGRTMRGGEVHINGVPLRENPVRFEPSALTATPLSELLRSSHPEISVHSWHRGQTSPLSDASGLHAYVADCESDDDLDRLARLAVDHSDRLLAVGASGLGTALAKQLGARGTRDIVSANRSATKRIANILFVIGSRTPASAEQVARLLDEGAQEAMPFPFATDDVANSFGSDGIQPSLMVLRPPTSLEFARHSSDEIAAALGQNAARLARDLKIDAVVMSGGDTALATFQALGIKHAVLRHELSPGTAIGVLEIEGAPVTFVTKSGSFGDGDALIQIARSLRSV
jgi:uncharacterized protein YgbK (DUF1537 family)